MFTPPYWLHHVAFPGYLSPYVCLREQTDIMHGSISSALDSFVTGSHAVHTSADKHKPPV